MDDSSAPVFLQELFVDEVDVGDFLYLLLQVGIVLGIEAIGGGHLGDGLGLLQVLDVDLDFQVSPVCHVCGVILSVLAMGLVCEAEGLEFQAAALGEFQADALFAGGRGAEGEDGFALGDRALG